MQVGKQFDALLVDTQAPDASDPVFYTFQSDSMAVSLIANLALYCSHVGPQRNIQQVALISGEAY